VAPSADRPLYGRRGEQADGFGLVPPEEQPPPDRDLVAGQQLQVGGLRFDVRHTPGHSPGSVCFVGHGAVFSGDVLFAGSIGRTDLPGGDFETLIASIERELLPLPDGAGGSPESTERTAPRTARRRRAWLAAPLPAPAARRDRAGD